MALLRPSLPPEVDLVPLPLDRAYRAGRRLLLGDLHRLQAAVDLVGVMKRPRDTGGDEG